MEGGSEGGGFWSSAHRGGRRETAGESQAEGGAYRRERGRRFASKRFWKDRVAGRTGGAGGGWREEAEVEAEGRGVSGGGQGGQEGLPPTAAQRGTGREQGLELGLHVRGPWGPGPSSWFYFLRVLVPRNRVPRKQISTRGTQKRLRRPPCRTLRGPSVRCREAEAREAPSETPGNTQRQGRKEL